MSPDDGSVIDLHNPWLAALLAWCVPGLGHFYQGRRHKGGLFMGVILGMFLAGVWLGGGKVVYASWKPAEPRWAFVCQAGVGLAAMPALVQSMQLAGAAKQPLLASTFMAPPLFPGQYVSRAYAERLVASDPDIDQELFFDKPPLRQFRADQLSMWQRRLGRWFEFGTLYTMLAGMLNILAIYDAFAGPLGAAARDESDPRRS
ncbi:MAG: hypothetical protein DWH79_05210 [Planctomycetota bacterium]|nr:MAG: hypothetical protein DWH79_05210 [Planctomycetota bacterium]